MRNILIFFLLSGTALCKIIFSSAKPYSNIVTESSVRLNKLSKMRAGMQVFVRSFADSLISVGTEPEESWKEEAEPDHQGIIFRGKQLDGLKSDYNIKKNSTPNKVMQVRGGFSSIRSKFQILVTAEGNQMRVMNERDRGSRIHRTTTESRRTMHTTAAAARHVSSSRADYERRYVANLTAIANLCRSEPLEVSWEDFQRTEFVLPEDRITRVYVTSKASAEEAPTSVVGYFLPTGMSWFTYTEAGISGSSAKNALIIKATSLLDHDIRNKTLDNLRNKVSQVWLGHSGIGKTVEVNYIMMELLRNLGEEGWPKQVAHRIGCEIFYYEVVDGRVRCRVIKNGCWTLADLHAFCEKHEDKKDSLVLVLEKDEKEIDPILKGITTFMALPSFKVDTMLGTLRISQDVDMAVRSPHSVEEALLVTEIMYTVDKEATLDRAEVSSTASLDEFQTVMAERIEKNGPLLHKILTRDHFPGLVNPTNYFYPFFNNLDIENIPTRDDKFVAPYISTDKELLGTFRFLNNKLALAVRINVREDSQAYSLKLSGLDSQIKEAMVMHALLNDSSSARYWERYVDPGYKKSLNHTHRVQTSPFRMPTAKRVVRFGTPILHKDASTMRDGDLYRSTLVSCPVSCEFFLYENSNGKRRITFYQTATGPLPQHPIPVAALKEWFEALGLYEQQNSDVEVVIEAVVDSSQSTTKGMKFLGEQQKALDIAGLRALFPGRNISTSIVRAPLYPNLSRASKQKE